MITAEQARHITENLEFCLLEELSDAILIVSKNGGDTCLFDITNVSSQQTYYLYKKLVEYGYTFNTVYDDNKIYIKVSW